MKRIGIDRRMKGREKRQFSLERAREIVYNLTVITELLEKMKVLVHGPRMSRTDHVQLSIFNNLLREKEGDNSIVVCHCPT